MKLIRQLTRPDAKRLQETIERQQRARKVTSVMLDSVVADLSAGFWVSLLSKSYDLPFVWRDNLGHIFPNDRVLRRAQAAAMCRDLLELRNRVAHHEPIYHLPLDRRRADLSRLLAGMCEGAQAYADNACTLAPLWADRP